MTSHYRSAPHLLGFRGSFLQPEVAAKAVYFAAHHRRREIPVGAPTVKAVAGNRIAPGIADRWLARIGVSGQQSPETVPPDRPDNFWEPVPGDAGAHGRFDDEAVGHSPQLWLTTHRGVALLAGGVAATAAAAAPAISLVRRRDA
jgi:hypothetical protein